MWTAYFLCLISLIVPLHLLAENLLYATFLSFVAACLSSFVVHGYIFLAWKRATSNNFKSIVMTLLTGLVFWNITPASQHLFDTLASIQHVPPLSVNAKRAVTLIVIAAAFFLCRLFYRRGLRWAMPREGRALFIIFVHIAVLLPVGDIAYSQFQSIAFTHNTLADAPQAEHGGTRPDIYYIILDGYGRDDVLNTQYRYDNSEFTDFLRSTGFYVADKSHSNYGQTRLSLASSLNFDFIDNLVDIPHLLHSGNNAPFRQLIAHSKVREILAHKGYRFIAMQSGDPVATVSDADIFLAPPHEFFFNQSMYLIMMLKISPLPLLAELFYPPNQDCNPDYLLDHVEQLYTTSFAPSNEFAANIVFQFNAARSLESHSPKFVFLHILSPHPPFLFSGDESLTSYAPIIHQQSFGLFDGIDYTRRDPILTERYITRYTKQLHYINRQTESLVTTILNRNPNSIIIIQGDHGPAAHYDYEKGTGTDLPERYSILNSYYFSNHDYHLLYPSISPVNSFSIIFNSFFNSHYKLRPDRSFNASYKTPYQLQDITAYLKE